PLLRTPPTPPLFPYTTLFRSNPVRQRQREFLPGRRPCLANVISADRHRIPPRHLPNAERHHVGHKPHRRFGRIDELLLGEELLQDRKSTRLNSSHVKISYAVF